MNAASIPEQGTTQAPTEPIFNSGAGFQAAPNFVIETGGTTIYTADTAGNVVTRSRLDDISTSLWSSLEQPGAKDITDFLAKPTLLQSGSFTTTDTGNFAITNLPEAFMANSRISNKLAGVALMRADIVLTLQVNAVRFQQGRYVLAYVPTGGLTNSNSGAQAFYRAHAANMTSVSQLPHVEIDLATQTTAELRIPYSSIFPYFKVSGSGTYGNSLGIAFLRPYSTLQAGSGDTTCGYMLFGRLENVVLSGNVLPQSGRRVGFKVSKGKSVTAIEQNTQRYGPVSSVLNTVSEGTAVLSRLPILGSILGRVSWASDILAGAAASFGFSKPLLLDKVLRTSRIAFPYSGTADGFTPAQPLSLKTDNEVVIHSGVGRTDIDEMSIDFIKQQYAYYDTVTWTSVQTTGTIITKYYHNPNQYYTSLGVNGNVPAPVCMLGRNFRVWRGGLKFKIKFAKTEFHSGRLIFAYAPYTGITATNPGVDTSTFLVREIVDVRETSEVEFCVPYVIPELYVPSFYNSGSPLVNSAGVFYIIVGDPLVAPSSVTSSINMMVEVAGAPDLEFAIPTGYNDQAVIPFATQSGRIKDIDVEDVEISEAQSSYLKHECQEFGMDSTDLNSSAVAIGEKAESLRQIIKRISPMLPSGGTFPSGTAGQCFILNAHAINPVFETVSINGTLVSDTWTTDTISNIAMCYVYNNGGMRYFLPPVAGTQPGTAVTVDRDPSRYQLNTHASYATYTPVRSAPTQLFFAADDPIHVTVPSYSRMIGRCTAAQIVTQVGLYSTPPNDATGQNTVAICVQPINSATAALNIRPYKYCSDDYSMSFWIGTVPTIGA